MSSNSHSYLSSDTLALLKKIGTKDSVPALESYRDKQGAESGKKEVQDVLDAIAKRGEG